MAFAESTHEKTRAGQARASATTKGNRMLNDGAMRVISQQVTGLFSAPATDRRRAEAWFDGMMKRSRKEGIIAEAVKITPAIAELLLERNPENRKRSANMVAKLATEMREGRWVRNGESLIVSDTGELNDGQHRCSACVVAGVDFETMVVFGVPRVTRATLDQGKKRTNADVVGMYGFVDQNNLAHAARIFYELDTFGTLTRAAAHRASATQTIEVIQNNPKLADDLSIGRKARGAKLGNIGLFAALHRYCAVKSNEAQANQFFEVITSALGFAGKSDPAYVLHKRLVEGEKLTETERAAFVIKAYNAWRSDEVIRTLRYVAGEDFPAVE